MVLVGASSAPLLPPARVGGAHGPPIRRRGGRLVSPRAGRHPEPQAAAHFGPPVLAPATGVAPVKAGARGFRSRLLGLEVRLKAALDDPAFRELFKGTAVKRTGRDRFVRNVLIAIGNSADPDLASVAERLLDDPAPLVRAMAVWALCQLVSPQRFSDLRETRLVKETDPEVCTEWTNGPREGGPASL